MVDAEYMDFTLAPGMQIDHAIKRGNTAFSYIFEGDGRFDEASMKTYGQQELVLYGDGDSVRVKAGSNGLRFLMISGRPLREPVAWGGPIVMNTDAELDRAFKELRDGTFIKKR